jgi:hypothetical protein
MFERMMSMKLICLFGAAALISGCAATADSPYAQRRAAAYTVELEKALEGKVAGKPQSCIDLRRANGTQQIGERTILYKVSRKLVYRNDPVGGCAGLRRDRALVTRLYSSQLCRGDLVTPTDFTTGFSGGSCALGDFVPYQAN